MKRPFNLLFVFFLAITTFSLSAPVLAQSTSSVLRVQVTDDAGSGVAGVPVMITHVPTGRVQTVTSSEVGTVTARGLAVGGPYMVRVAANSTYSGEIITDIFLELDRTEQVALRVERRPEIEEVVTTGKMVGTELRVGVGRDFGTDVIESIPSISRDFVSTIATDPNILVDNSVARGPAVSVAGQNFRFNSVTIDGVAQNDNFGLSKNASATQRSPISIDAIQEINVNVAPYDVTYGNFIGGNINIVTRSGTNEFHGSAFYYTTGDSFSGDKTDGVNLGIRDFDEDVYGFTLGGPIVRDKLFFFANYEKFKTTLPSNSQTIDAIAGVTQQDVDDAIEIFKEVYDGFDPGRFDATDTDQDEKYLLKLDWNINDRHRAVATYQVADGDVLFDDFPEVAVLQSNRYNINEKLTAFSFQAFSDWTDRFSTEVKFGFKDVENRQISIDTMTPDFAVTAPGGGTITAGGDRFRHTNELDNKSRIIRLKGDYEMGDHTLTAGFEQEKYEVRNLFLPFSKGNYIFPSLEALAERDISEGFVLYGNSNTGVAKDAEANFELAVDSLYIQDEWTVTDDLVLKFGLRADKYKNNDPIPLNSAFASRNGFDNTENLDEKDLLLPRFGFNWDATDRLTLRGGVGLFGGGTPLIVLSNSYSGNGVTRTFASFLAPFFGPPVSDSIETAVNALPDPTAAFTNFQQYIGFNPDGDVDAMDPNFKPLSTWKYSLGADYELDLSRIGLGSDWQLRANVVHSDVNNGYDIYEGRRRVVGSAPDGRPIYDIPAGGDYIVRNTGQGGGQVYSLNLAKAFDTDWGLFDTTLGYTHQDLTEVRSYNRFVGFETYAFDPQSDLNNPTEAHTRYETKNRITSTVSWQKRLFGDNATSLSFAYYGRSGPKYSYVFGSQGLATFGGTFLADFGSEGDNPGPQLFYVPTGTSDPIITGDPAFLADLNAFIDSDECLRGARGSIVRRNSCETDWVNVLNMRLVQEFGFMENKKLEFIFDIENLLNFINDDWGRVESYTAPSNVAPAKVAISADGSQYILTPTASYAGTPQSIVSQPSIARLPSVYRIQLGLRFSF